MKQKKLLLFTTLGLILLFVLGMSVVSLAACSHTFNSSHVCTKCGYQCTHPTYTSYTSSGATMHYRKCTVCGAQFNQKHSFNSSHKCTLCGYICTHPNYTDYTSSGATMHYRKCKICDAQFNQKHSFNSNHKCTLCGYTCTHPSYTSYTSSGATMHYRKCSVCGAQFNQKHSFNTSHKCTLCGYTCTHSSYTDYIANGASSHYRECKICGAKFSQIHIDENNDKKCDYCGYQMGTTTSSPNLQITGPTYEGTEGTSLSFSYTRDGSGVVSASSSNTNVTVSMAGPEIKVALNKAGTATITVSVSQAGNYTSQSKSFNVTIKEKATTIALQGITVANSSKTLNVGTEYNMGAKKVPSNATPQILYKSSDATIAYVDENGNVKAKKAGTVTITAYYGSISATTKLTYQDSSTSKRIEINGPDEVTIGKSITLDAGGIGVTWSVTSGATLSATSGLGTILTAGTSPTTVTVTATANGYEKGTKTIKVVSESTYIKLTSIRLLNMSKIMYVGDTYQMGAAKVPSNASATITYSSSDPSIATVDKYGNVKALKRGTNVAIYAKADGITAKLALTVIEKDTVELLDPGLRSDYKTVTIYVGESYTFNLSYSGTARSLSLGGNSNPGIASPNLNSGNKTFTVTGLKPGVTTFKITVAKNDQYKEGSTSIEVIVKEKPASITPGDPGGNPGEPPVTVTEDLKVYGKYNGVELSTLPEKRTVLPTQSKIDVSALPTDKIAKIEATWDDSTTPIVIIGSNGTLTLPSSFTPGSKHILTLIATDGNNSVRQVYYIEIEVAQESGDNPDERVLEPNVDYNGEKLNPEITTTVNTGDPLRIYGDPEEKTARLVYIWDMTNPVGEIIGSSGTIYVPNDFAPGSTHKLLVQAIGTDGNASQFKEYTFTIPGDNLPGDNPLEVLPWEAENFELTQLAISLRNDSLSTKGNKNVYALNEEVTYYIDFKNGGDDITGPVKISLKVPLTFEIIEMVGGDLDTSTGIITWTYPDGMRKNYSGTKVIKLRYVALSDSSLNGETIYPLATIYANDDPKDKSAVINYIYRDSDTFITVLHSPFMYGDKEKPTFRPDYTISRAEGALVLARILLGQDAIDNTQVLYNFPDITETYLEAQKAITLCTSTGIIKGYPDGTYRPLQSMTRAEFLKILATYLEINARNSGVEGLEIKDTSKLVKVYNNPVSQYIVNGKVVTKHWAINEISLLIRLNMTTASTYETDLRIDRPISRAEVAQQVNYYLLRAPAKVDLYSSIQFRDVSFDHRLIGDIIEATRLEHAYRITSDGYEKDN